MDTMIGDPNKRNPFAGILRPLTLEEFVDSNWEETPRLIPGESAKFADLAFDKETFNNAVQQTQPGYLKVASPSRETGESQYKLIDKEDAGESLASGMTLCVTGIDRYVPTLRALSIDTKGTLGLAGGVHCNCYMSPEGEGFGIHFDTQSIFLLQIEGSKHWRFGSLPASAFPREPVDGLPHDQFLEYQRRFAGIEVTDLQDTAFDECTLVPGDVLYLPPGTWHSGRAGTHSLAITLTCRTFDFSALLCEQMESQLFQTLPWRRNLPSTLEHQPGSERNTSSMEEYAAARLRELETAIAGLRTSSFVDAWLQKMREFPEI